MCSQWLLPKNLKSKLEGHSFKTWVSITAPPSAATGRMSVFSSNVQAKAAARQLPYVHVHIREYFLCNSNDNPGYAEGFLTQCACYKMK